MAKPRTRRARRPKRPNRPHNTPEDGIVRAAAKLWKRWLHPPARKGAPPPGEGQARRPLPLDAFLSHALRGEDRQRAANTTEALRATAAYATTAMALLAGPDEVPDTLPELMAALRRFPAAPLVATCRHLLHESSPPPAPVPSRTVSPPPGLPAYLAERRAAWPNDLRHRLIRAGVPPAWQAGLHTFAQVHGDEALDAWLDALGRRPALWLRVLDERALEGDGSLVHEGFALVHEHGAVRAEGHVPIARSTAYRNGWIEVQDLASQQIGRAVRAQPEQLIWDVCAGRGGKSMQIAAALGGKGTVHATDLHDSQHRVRLERAERLGLCGVLRSRTWDGLTPPNPGRAVTRQGGFDAVLVDAPCSATGTWRRDPDARLRAPRTDGFDVLQRELLQTAAQQVRPGGRLIYGTCSVLPSENTSVMDATTSRLGRGWRLDSADSVGFPHADADRMFVAVWTRAV